MHNGLQTYAKICLRMQNPIESSDLKYFTRLIQSLDKDSNSGGALFLKTVNFKVNLEIPGAHYYFSTRI